MTTLKEAIDHLENVIPENAALENAVVEQHRVDGQDPSFEVATVMLAARTIEQQSAQLAQAQGNSAHLATLATEMQSSLGKEIEARQAAESRLSSVLSAARGGGFTGNKGSEMIDFLRERLFLADQAEKALQSIARSLSRIDPELSFAEELLKDPSDFARRVDRLAEESANRLGAQQATIEALAGPLMAKQQIDQKTSSSSPKP